MTDRPVWVLTDSENRYATEIGQLRALRYLKRWSSDVGRSPDQMQADFVVGVKAELAHARLLALPFPLRLGQPDPGWDFEGPPKEDIKVLRPGQKYIWLRIPKVLADVRYVLYRTDVHERIMTLQGALMGADIIDKLRFRDHHKRATHYRVHHQEFAEYPGSVSETSNLAIQRELKRWDSP